MTTMGRAMMGTGKASGENRAELAADQALTNPLLDDSSIKGAKSVLINISGGLDLTLEEVDIIMQKIVSQVDENANVKFGSTVNEDLEGSVQVSIVATGLGEPVKVVPPQSPAPQPNPKPEVEGIHFKETEIRLTHSESEGNKVSSEEPPLIPQNDFGFAPVLKRNDVPAPSELEVEVSEEGVTIPKSLFTDTPPVVAKVTSPKEEPKEKPDVNLGGQKDSNVKTSRTNLFDLLPGLMGRGLKNAPKPKETVKTEKHSEEDGLESIPSFLRRR